MLCCCHVAVVCVILWSAFGYCTVCTFSAVGVAFFCAFDVLFCFVLPLMHSHCFVGLFCVCVYRVWLAVSVVLCLGSLRMLCVCCSLMLFLCVVCCVLLVVCCLLCV